MIRVLTGFALAIAVLMGGGYVAAQYLISQFTALPPKPTFPNDKPAPKPKPAEKPAPPQPAPQPSASVSPSPAAAVPGYQARVKLSEGLNLRDKPSRSSSRVAGLDYDDRVVILEETPDKEWQKIRLAENNQEGWIKAGYTERVN
ncbi:MAG TPA: SH3 domain-containing protein [Thermosynechococcaceae cyanobacterium]